MASVPLPPAIPYCFCQTSSGTNHSGLQVDHHHEKSSATTRNNNGVDGFLMKERSKKKDKRLLLLLGGGNVVSDGGVPIITGSGAGGRRCWRIYASSSTDTRLVQDHQTHHNNVYVNNAAGAGQVPSTSGSIEIPVTCYQVLGVPIKAEKDEVVKAVMHLRNTEVEEGYTEEAVVSRQNLLMDVRDKLLFEPEYAGNIKEKLPPKSSLRIPWAWLPGALCLLQEVGEEKLVLDIGRRALQHPDSKPHIHDILLSMALAECAIAKNGFEKNNISQGFEALARAQCLLRSKISLGKMTLLSQIEESLEDLAPACTLELLGMPHTPENAERRLGAIAALRELLRQGLDVESSCQVQDWPCFLSQALNKLMATEIVELLPWDNLAITRKNKKSLESQNQRVVIDFNCFYIVLIAHMALGFSSKQTDLINKAKMICECLTTSEGVDLKFEEAFCLFLLGQGDEATASERLRQLEQDSNTASRNIMPGKDIRNNNSDPKKSLETWLKDAVLGMFPDTRDCSPSLAGFFTGEKRPPGNRQNKRASQTASNINHRPLAPALTLDRRVFEESGSSLDSPRHLCSAVKQLAASNLQGPLIAGKDNDGRDVSTSSVQLKRSLGSHQNKFREIWLASQNMVGKIIYAVALGCILFASFKLLNMQFWRMGSISRWRLNQARVGTCSCTANSFLDHDHGTESIKRNRFVSKLKKLLLMLSIQQGNKLDSTNMSTCCPAAGLSASTSAMYLRPMPVEEAETLVKQWQAVKAEALGPSHYVHGLYEVLDDSMLIQWEALADSAKGRSCFWRFVLLQLSILQANILTDRNGNEMAEIDALLEEAAELVDDSQPKNSNYYSTYKIRYILKRQDDGSWKFCEGHVQVPELSPN